MSREQPYPLEEQLITPAAEELWTNIASRLSNCRCAIMKRALERHLLYATQEIEHILGGQLDQIKFYKHVPAMVLVHAADEVIDYVLDGRLPELRDEAVAIFAASADPHNPWTAVAALDVWAAGVQRLREAV